MVKHLKHLDLSGSCSSKDQYIIQIPSQSPQFLYAIVFHSGNATISNSKHFELCSHCPTSVLAVPYKASNKLQFLECLETNTVSTCGIRCHTALQIFPMLPRLKTEPRDWGVMADVDSDAVFPYLPAAVEFKKRKEKKTHDQISFQCQIR